MNLYDLLTIDRSSLYGVRHGLGSIADLLPRFQSTHPLRGATVKEYAANFDIDEHIELWIEAKRNGVKGVPSARELVYDAEAICKMLQELAAALAKEEPA